MASSSGSTGKGALVAAFGDMATTGFYILILINSLPWYSFEITHQRLDVLQPRGG